MPDTAHALAGVTFPTPHQGSKGSLRLIRQDIESSAMPTHLAQNAGTTVDWDKGTFGSVRKALHYVAVNTVKGVGRYGPPIDCHPLWYWHRDHLIGDAVALFSQYEEVITNRLHAMILGLLLNRQVTAFDNSYGKLSTYHDSWLKGVEGLTFVKGEVRDQVNA